MSTETKSSDDFLPLATVIANTAIQSRIGFGSFRKHRALFDRSLELVTNSCLLALPNGQSPWHIDPEYIYFNRKRGGLNPAHFFRRLLVNPNSFEPSCIWSLFWALAKCEHEFTRRYLPFWSHEERLTGHFISQLCERVEEFAPRWAELSGSDADKSALDLWYADTATYGRENETGADFGLIIEANYSGEYELLKAARFQVKKVPSNNSARLDFNQTKALLSTPSLGYYLFYHGQDKQEWRRPPTVAPASAFAYALREIENKLAEGKSLQKTNDLGRHSMDSVDHKSYDFAMFLVFALADPGADFGAVARSKREAVQLLMGGGALSPPSRLLVISLGSTIHPPDWLHALGDNIKVFGNDE